MQSLDRLALAKPLCYLCLGGLIPRRKVKSFLMERIFQSMDLNITGVIMFRSYSKTTILLTI